MCIIFVFCDLQNHKKVCDPGRNPLALVQMHQKHGRQLLNWLETLRQIRTRISTGDLHALSLKLFTARMNFPFLQLRSGSFSNIIILVLFRFTVRAQVCSSKSRFCCNPCSVGEGKTRPSA